MESKKNFFAKNFSMGVKWGEKTMEGSDNFPWDPFLDLTTISRDMAKKG